MKTYMYDYSNLVETSEIPEDYITYYDDLFKDRENPNGNWLFIH